MSGSALSVRATARLVAAWAVLAGLFFMHGLATQGCAGGVTGVHVTGSAPSMAHPVTVTTAAGGPDTAFAMTASVNHPIAHSAPDLGDAGEPGALCVSTPPSPGWAGLLALLLVIGVAGLAGILRSPTTATRPDNQRRRAPPPGGSALLMNLCVSRT